MSKSAQPDSRVWNQLDKRTRKILKKFRHIIFTTLEEQRHKGSQENTRDSNKKLSVVLSDDVMLEIIKQVEDSEKETTRNEEC